MMRRMILQLLMLGLLECLAIAQANAPSNSGSNNFPVIKVSSEPAAANEIIVPPSTSVSFRSTPFFPEAKEINDVGAWLHTMEGASGLSGPDMKPRHIVISYDQFDEDGDNVNSGVMEEFWAGPKKYKRVYKSDKLNQEDYATEKGLFRKGDQRWPNVAELQVRSEVINPFTYIESLRPNQIWQVDRTFGTSKLGCYLIQKNAVKFSSDPPQYCFDVASNILRYVRGDGWNQTVYNDLRQFEGRLVSRDIEVTHGGKPFLKMRITKLEELSADGLSELIAPPDAISLAGKRVSGVQMTAISAAQPVYPISYLSRHSSGEVVVGIVIAKDGHVISAHALSGPFELYKACEDAALKWKFRPFLVLDEPVEVESRLSFRFQMR